MCLGNLSPTSVMAYSNKDLIANGFIPKIGLTAREFRARGGAALGVNAPVKQAYKLLPSDEIYCEFWYDGTGSQTNVELKDLGTGGGAGLALGAASNVLEDILGTSLGAFDNISSSWTFHVANSSTKINREIELAENDFFTGADGDQYAKVRLPDYALAVLGVTVTPINFLAPIAITEAQRSTAANLSAEEIEKRLGVAVHPSDLSDADVCVLLGIPQIDELSTLGNSRNQFRGWRTTNDGQIQAEFTAYKYGDVDKNLYVSWDRDPRKNRYRADNEFDRTSGHAIWNGSNDDITDKVLIIRITGKETDKINDKGEAVPGTKTIKLAAKSKVYVSYVGGESVFRHCIQAKVNLFIFGTANVSALPPLNNIKGWNYKKFEFLVPIDTRILSFTISEYKAAIQGKLPYKKIEAQRLIESKRNFALGPYIIGCYFMDGDGFSSYNFRTGERKLLWSRSDMGNTDVFDAALDKIIEKASYAYVDRILDVDVASRTIFGDFLFDVSQITNSVCVDNRKFGYESFCADAIKSFPKIEFTVDGIKEETFIAPKLDLINDTFEDLDLEDPLDLEVKTLSESRFAREVCIQNVNFVAVESKGAPQLFTCNILLRYDDNWKKPRIQADFLLRTPLFTGLNLKSTGRIYVEKFQAKLPLRPDGGIFVGSRLTTEYRYGLAKDEYSNISCLAYVDTNTNTLKYKLFDDFATFDAISFSSQYAGKPLPAFGHLKPKADDFIGVYDAGTLGDYKQPSIGSWGVSNDNSRGITDRSLITPGYSNQFTEKPGYYNGKEPDISLIAGRIGGIISSKFLPALIFSHGKPFAESKDAQYQDMAVVRIIDASLGSGVPSGADNSDKYTYFTVTPFVIEFSKRQQFTNIWDNTESLHYADKSMQNSIYESLSKSPMRMRRIRITFPIPLSGDLSQPSSLRTNPSNKIVCLIDSATDPKPHRPSLLGEQVASLLQSTISLVFPFDNRIIDQIKLDGNMLGSNVSLATKNRYSQPYPGTLFAGDAQLYNAGENVFAVDIAIDVGYARLLPFQIRGPALLAGDMSCLKIWVEDYITEEEYEKIRIETTSVSTCFDSAQNLYIFYEDSKANKTLLHGCLTDSNGNQVCSCYNGSSPNIGSTPACSEGGFSLPPFKPAQSANASFAPVAARLDYDIDPDLLRKPTSPEQPANQQPATPTTPAPAANTENITYPFALLNDISTEISCLFSPDLGETWYDFKAVVRTVGREQIGNPIAIRDHRSDGIHLFYNLQGNLMHKHLRPTDFKAEDTFKGYVRPLADFTVKTPENLGLYHFSVAGQKMRARTSNVVIENVKSQYINSQIAIRDEYKQANRSDYRFDRVRNSNASDGNALTGSVGDGRELLDCFFYKDVTGVLNLVYAVNGKLFIKQSSDDGQAWTDTIRDGIFIHRNSPIQEYRDVSTLGFAYDTEQDLLCLTYFCDDMMFVRRIPGTNRSQVNNDNKTESNNNGLEWSYNAHLQNSKNPPIFVTGNINDEIMQLIKDDKHAFIFPYAKTDLEKFDDNSGVPEGRFDQHLFAAKDLPSKGVYLSNGLVRFFYLDQFDVLQGFILDDKPMLDMQISKYAYDETVLANPFVVVLDSLYGKK